MRTVVRKLDPRHINLKEYLREFDFGENYRFTLKHLKGDLVGGLTAAIVALPLALGFGLLAFNGDPRGAVAGLYGAIFTGVLASFFGGTPQQITGPTGGMTVILTTVYMEYGGPEALLAACILAGVFQVIYGLLKVGKYVHLVPYPVTVGFTNGIAILIFTQQFKTFNTAPVIALVTIAVIYLVPKVNRNLPKALIGLIAGTIVAYAFSSNDLFRASYDPATGGLTFASAIKVIGEIPSHFQLPGLPDISWETWRKLVPAGFTISMLGSIETLLASVVADNATNTRHNSNKELIGQGVGNFVAGVFGGVAGTGAIVRTMVNVRAGGMTRLSGIIHGVVLILVMLFLGTLASNIPLAALAGVLMMTAIGMLELEPIKMIPRTPLPDAAVMVATILITVLTDLITAVEVGMVMASFLFVHRMSEMGMDQRLLEEVKGVALDEPTQQLLKDNKIVIFDVEGPLFFGAAKSFITTLEKHFDVKVVILDMENVPVIDTSGTVAIENIVERLHHDKKRLLIVGMRDNVRKVLYDLGVTKKIGIGNFLNTVDEAIRYALEITKREVEQTYLGGFVSESLIMLDVKAKDRDDLLDKMVTQACNAGVVKSRELFLESILQREALTPTIIGKGVAVPHAHSGGANGRVVVVFARLKEPIHYNQDNPELIRLVFMVATGTNEREYLNVLRLIATNISHEHVYKRLLSANDVHAVHHLLSELKTTQPLTVQSE
ncbi:MAG: PTS sugar transporter subunit IIA [Ignavibacteriales bacterium]|nr:PTS sugar transporter subunit IIA [Ignavibacteriales bacterium]